METAGPSTMERDVNIKQQMDTVPGWLNVTVAFRTQEGERQFATIGLGKTQVTLRRHDISKLCDYMTDWLNIPHPDDPPCDGERQR